MAFSVVGRASDWYRRHERPISSLSLIGGFVFDAVTLHRVGEFWENFWVTIHLLAVVAAILLIHRLERAREDTSEEESRTHFWLVNALQFFFGGLLSTFLIFYFRSAALEASWPFLAILGVAFVANERLKKHYERVIFQASFLFLSIFLFAIFLVPVIVHSIGPLVFVLSGATSLGLMTLFLWFFHLLAREEFERSKRSIFISVGAIFVLFNTLYFVNIIPPIPLSLSDGGIYYSVERAADGSYVLKGEPRHWWSAFLLSQTVHEQSGPLYAFTAIYSPADFSTEVVHEWQKYDQTSGEWRTEAKIYLTVVGGRDQGYRTYSSEITSLGKWRVNVETASGQLIGRVSFAVVPTQ